MQGLAPGQISDLELSADVVHDVAEVEEDPWHPAEREDGHDDGDRLPLAHRLPAAAAPTYGIDFYESVLAVIYGKI
jgi:hypothetical protein